MGFSDAQWSSFRAQPHLHQWQLSFREAGAGRCGVPLRRESFVIPRQSSNLMVGLLVLGFTLALEGAAAFSAEAL